MRTNLLTASLLLLLSTGSAAIASPAIEPLEATITEAEGLVKKRDYIDWNKEQWGEATSAKAGDNLHEGMQLGTGDKSWAEVKWPHVTARAWANSSYAIAPNHKLVYLSNGEMLFQLDKHRKDKDSYCIWTNLLQARIRGTTVLVQSTGESSRISVLEGTIDVLNRLEHSVVRLSPGVVYEVKTPSASPIRQTWVTDVNNKVASITPGVTNTNSGVAETASTALANPSTKLGTILNTAPVANLETTKGITYLPNMITEKIAGLPLFETGKSITSLYLIDAKAVLNDVLGSGFKNPLPSAPLVTQSLNSLLNVENSPLVATNLLKTNVTTLRVPVLSNYKIGQVFSTILPLPETALSHWTPTGWISSPAPANNVNQTLTADGILPGTHFRASREVKALPILQSARVLQSPFSLVQIATQLPGGSSLPGATPIAGGGLLVNNSVLVGANGAISSATASLATQNILRGITTSGGLGTTTLLTNATTGLTTNGALTNNLLTNTTTSLLGQNGLVANTVNGVTTLLNPVTGIVAGVVNPLTGAVTNLVNPLTGQLNTTLSATTVQTQALLNSLLRH